jgi:hypothetical protein
MSSLVTGALTSVNICECMWVHYKSILNELVVQTGPLGVCQFCVPFFCSLYSVNTFGCLCTAVAHKVKEKEHCCMIHLSCGEDSSSALPCGIFLLMTEMLWNKNNVSSLIKCWLDNVM